MRYLYYEGWMYRVHPDLATVERRCDTMDEHQWIPFPERRPEFRFIVALALVNSYNTAETAGLGSIMEGIG